MQQYLINTTAIWLLSLLFFDVFLRRENYHTYNRFYLLFTLLLGALLPLVQWSADSITYPAMLHAPVERVVAVKQTMARAATAPAGKMDWAQWLAFVYGVGVLVSLCALIFNVIKLIGFSAGGKRSVQGCWNIVETGKDHGPFSFRSTLFVGSRQQYSNDEWQMILVHEGRHCSLWHFADLLLIHLARIVFWFHPLVYVYNKRLLLVHEYQADNAAAAEPQRYGKFLIEQAIFRASPSIAHSFNRSPIKNRIVMLTRNSTATARAKMLVLLPLMAIALSCFSKNATSGSKEFKKTGNTVTYNGNTFTLSEGLRDTITVVDPVTAKELTQVRILEPAPISMNGRKIYNAVEVTTEPQQFAHSVSIEEHILANLAGDIDALPNGSYWMNISNIVVDETGKVIYYEFRGISGTGRDADMKLSQDLTKSLAQRVDLAMRTAPVMKPATLNGKNVIVNSDISMYDYRISVSNHITTYSKGRR